MSGGGEGCCKSGRVGGECVGKGSENGSARWRSELNEHGGQTGSAAPVKLCRIAERRRLQAATRHSRRCIGSSRKV
jgi:hypothetical protein